jgi:hypothetical protein
LLWYREQALSISGGTLPGLIQDIVKLRRENVSSVFESSYDKREAEKPMSLLIFFNHNILPQNEK